MGPPLEYESISFFASSMKFKAAVSPLFSGLLISELYARKIGEESEGSFCTRLKTKLHREKKG